MAPIRLTTGEYEISAKQARTLGRETDSLMSSRCLFFSAVLFLSADKDPGLREIAATLPNSLPKVWIDPEGWSAAVAPVAAGAAAAWCCRKGLSDSWCVAFALMAARSILWCPEDSSLSRYFEGIEALLLQQSRPLPEQPLTVDFGDWNVI